MMEGKTASDRHLQLQRNGLPTGKKQAADGDYSLEFLNELMRNRIRLSSRNTQVPECLPETYLATA